MKFETLGNKENPAILFFHAMGVVGQSNSPVANYLKNKYFCIMPTSTVYCKKQKYISKNDEIRQVEEFLHNENINSLAMVVASSIGTDLAVAFLSQTRIKVEHVFIDGGQFAQINKSTRHIMVPFLYLAIKSLYWSKGKTLKKILWCDDDSIKPYFINAGKELTYSNMHRQLMDSLENKPFPQLSKQIQEITYFEFGNTKLSNITVIALNTFFDETLKKANGERYAPNTIRNIRRVLNSILKLARAENLIGFNPVQDLSPIKGANANTRTALTAEEAIELLEGAKAYYEKKKDYKSANVMIYPFILLAMTTGLRIGEALAIKWEDIEPEKNIIHINKALNKEGKLQTPKTTQAYRDIVVSNDLMKLFLSFNDGLSPFLFHTKEGTPISIHNMERGLNNVLKFANIKRKTTPHEFRHTCATLAQANGASITDIQKLLGHAKASTTLDF